MLQNNRKVLHRQEDRTSSLNAWTTRKFTNNQITPWWSWFNVRLHSTKSAKIQIIKNRQTKPGEKATEIKCSTIWLCQQSTESLQQSFKWFTFFWHKFLSQILRYERFQGKIYVFYYRNISTVCHWIKNPK